jgi:hypothetical protein
MHIGVQARVPEETKIWFLTFSQWLRVILSGFADANPRDGRVAKAGTVSIRIPVAQLFHGFFIDCFEAG